MEYVVIIPWLAIFISRLNKSLHMLQQNSYNKDLVYFKWLTKNWKKTTLSFDLILIVSIIFIKNDTLIYLLFGITYSLLLGIYYINNKTNVIKKPLVYTARVKRLIATNILLYILLVIVLYTICNLNLYLILALIVYLQYFLLILVKFVNNPIEKFVYFTFKSKAVKKLKAMKNLKVIGITGSYGKTSSKNILNEILNIKYNSLPTPKNYNTPYGLLMTINDYLGKFDEVLIAEMGAKRQGEIKELCDLVHPQCGILTKIGTAHLETFGSQKIIQKTKFELIESLPKEGIGILNADDDLQVNYNLKIKAKVIWIAINNNDADIKAENIKTSNKGITFKLRIKGEKTTYPFETRLLGQANVYNILAAIALGLELKLSINDLQKAVKRVSPVEHRLELKQIAEDIYIIDDAYNSNPDGSKMALEVLDSMPGKKIIITPGMIELGELEYEANMKFGEYIADVCDEVILVGKNQTKPIQKGLENKKYKKERIHILEDVNDAFVLMKKLKDKETYVLIENDLPDSYK